jgi:hypothetical protein
MTTHYFKVLGIQGRTPHSAELRAFNAALDSAPLYTALASNNHVREDALCKGQFVVTYVIGAALPVSMYLVQILDSQGRVDSYGYGRATGVDGEVVVTFATPSEPAGDYATGTALATVANNVATLLARLTANAATALGRLFDMTTGTGVTAAFNAVALQLGPNGASSMWTLEDIAFAKQKLALLTLSSSVVTVPIGSAMCERGDIEKIFGPTNVAKWADIENNEDVDDIAAQITWAITISDSYFRAALAQSRWKLPESGDICPAILSYFVACRAGVELYDNKGVLSYDPEGEAQHALSLHRKRTDQFIASVKAGTLDLSPLKSLITDAAPTWTE